MLEYKIGENYTEPFFQKLSSYAHQNEYLLFLARINVNFWKNLIKFSMQHKRFDRSNGSVTYFLPF